MGHTGRSAPGYDEHHLLLCPKLSPGRARRDAVRREGLFRHGNGRRLRILERERLENCEVGRMRGTANYAKDANRLVSKPRTDPEWRLLKAVEARKSLPDCR